MQPYPQASSFCTVKEFFRFIFSLTIASWLSLVLQLLCPQRNLDTIFAYPLMLGIWAQLEGLRMGLGPFTVWQMVDYPNKPTNYLGFPLCARALLRVAAGPATRPANSGSAGTEGAHTLSLSHFLASSSSPPFLLVLIFHCQLWLIPLPLGKVSLSTNRSWRAFVSAQFSFFCLGGDCSWASLKGYLKRSVQMGLFWLISSPSVPPYRRQCNFDERANKWPMCKQNLFKENQ